MMSTKKLTALQASVIAALQANPKAWIKEFGKGYHCVFPHAGDTILDFPHKTLQALIAAQLIICRDLTEEQIAIWTAENHGVGKPPMRGWVLLRR